MNIWELLLPFELGALIGLSVYLIHLERRVRFLKRQEKRMDLAKDLGTPAEEPA